ncbi:hypothetical protein [Pseudodesulfovibrio piezophilus]|uniref:Uncharacterized protein n=1 Tax=Pseudodesulfovibrio piezophilus (strain DSM 21447 / JCM 15486 / C1TLV30) TaxID=1322246 RepID=M1WRL7_PSEP2|nr:hypothetical protein [Pseudodesulfovibrio piezophilus]CCH48362.1 conserved protein of unknown function [Pseudodesulfovibrio piezophilus C1TLV30]
MKKFLSIAEGKLVNDGMQPTAKAKLELLTDSEDAQPTFPFILESLGLHACLDAMDAVPYQHEDFVETTLRLLAIDAAYRVMPLWENTEVSQDGLKDLLQLAHLYAHGEVEHEEYQERMWEVAQPIMREDKSHSSITAAQTARDCALLSASHSLIPALNRAIEAVQSHHGGIARGCAYSYKADQEHALRSAWEHGGPISFGATFAVTSKHVLAAVEAEIWHVAYTIADELLGFVGYENVGITQKEMRSFLMEALASAGEDIAHEVLHKGARLVIDTAMAAGSFDEARDLARDAAQGVFRDACSDPDMYEQLAIGRTAIATACHDFEDHEAFAICHALHDLHEGSFYKIHPINAKANEIAKIVALAARKKLSLEQMAYAAASGYAGNVEMGIQTDVLSHFLSDA